MAPMKLYYLKGACSLASYISLIEAGQKFEAHDIDRATKKTGDGRDFNAINPKGYAPALQLDNGEVLTENVAVLSYIASLDKSGKLGAAPGIPGCFRLLEWLAYISSEVHKNYSPLFNPNATDDMKASAKANLARRLGFIEERLGDKPYLTGNDFTVADAYLYVVMSWSPRVGVDLSAFPKLRAFSERVHARPAVQQARKGEGLPA